MVSAPCFPGQPQTGYYKRWLTIPAYYLNTSLWTFLFQKNLANQENPDWLPKDLC